MPARGAIGTVIERNEQALLAEWIERQLTASRSRLNVLRESELQEQSRSLLLALGRSVDTGSEDLQSSAWDDVRDVLEGASRLHAQRGLPASTTATFVLSLKEPLFARLRSTLEAEPLRLLEEMRTITRLLDRLAVYTMEVYQKSREEIIVRQQQELLELSTPVVKLWNGILALPLIGTLDSARTQVVMENILQKIVDTGAIIAIIDITGVPTVDTLVAQHLMKTIAAARLMGADCIISGIRPQIAQTIVHLGVEINDVITKATLADAFAIALRRIGLTVTRQAAQRPRREAAQQESE